MLVFDDEFLLTVGGKVDLFILPVGLSSPHPSNWIAIRITTDPDPRIPDEEVVELVAELDELLLGFGFLGLDHASSIGG